MVWFLQKIAFKNGGLTGVLYCFVVVLMKPLSYFEAANFCSVLPSFHVLLNTRLKIAISIVKKIENIFDWKLLRNRI